jgi:hypothetical protein
MFIIPGNPGHAEIYQSIKDGSINKDLLAKIVGKKTPFGASIFPKGKLRQAFVLCSILMHVRCFLRTSMVGGM